MEQESQGLRRAGATRHLWSASLVRWKLDAAQSAMLVGVLLVTALVYLRCLGNGFVYDDYPAIVQNPSIAHWSFFWKYATRDVWWFRQPDQSPQSAYYRPLQNIWLALNYHLFGLNPVGWHAMKILLHLVVVLLSFRLAQLLTRSAFAGLLAALLFAVLPAHAEAVVWAEAIPEPLSAAFELAALCLFIRHTGRRWHLACPLLLAAGAMLSHESAVVLPLLIAAYVFLLETQGSARDVPAGPEEVPSLLNRVGRALAWSTPFFGIALLYIGLRAVVLGPGLLGWSAPKVKAAPMVLNGILVFPPSKTAHPFAEVLMSIPEVLICYLQSLVVPWLVGPAHDVKFVIAPDARNFFLPSAILVVLAALGYFTFRKSPRGRLYLFCAAWWVISLLPTLNLDHIVALVQDRYEYLASFGLCVLAGDWAVQTAQWSAVRNRLILATATALIAVEIGVLWRAEGVWHDNVALFSRSVEMFPDSSLYHRALAQALMDQGDLDGAVRHLVIAARLAPNDTPIHLALGLLYMRLRRDGAAAAEMEAYYGNSPKPVDIDPRSLIRHTGQYSDRHPPVPK
jgi:tetratricopeptide (TPR) repeat protein